MSQIDLSYPAIKAVLAGFAVKQRTESRQFLAWFLENYYRLEETERDDCICDGVDDKGIDAIYVSEQLNQIDVFQSRLFTTPKTLGDSALREFYGALNQMRNADSVNSVGSSTKNAELAALIRDKKIAEKVADGYKINGVFVTNVKRDTNAVQYLTTASDLTVFDSEELYRSYVAIDKTDPIAGSITFSLTGAPYMDYKVSQELHMIIAPVLAKDLVQMSGISNGELFAWNVRQWLTKKSQVNRDIEKSIQSSGEHEHFPAFHNGLTVICRTLGVKQGGITISGYAVVNGCQSLTSLHSNSTHLTNKLRIMTKFIKIAADSPLARKITDHTNNQNGVTHRDLQSNGILQTRLQTEINSHTPGQWYYRIKRGEHPEWDQTHGTVIENELAARMLLAFDLKEPWSCHQSYRLFDDLHGPIFGRRQVNGDRIIAIYSIYIVAIAKLTLMKDNEMFARYGLTKFLLLYLIREALATDTDKGVELLSRPSDFISQAKWQQRLEYSIGKITQTVVRLLDAEISRRSQPEPFDFKRELKGPKAVRELRSVIISHYQIILDAGSAPPFSELWLQAGKKKRR